MSTRSESCAIRSITHALGTMPSVFRTFGRQTLLPCSHREVTGDQCLHQAQEVSNVPPQLFQPHSFRITQAMACLLHTLKVVLFATSVVLLASCHVRTELEYSELWFTCHGKSSPRLMEHCSTCVKCLP